MVQSKQIKICDNIAKNLLKEYYNSHSAFVKNKDSIKLFCQEMSMENDFLKRFLFKITRHEVDNILVGAVIQSLPEEFQNFVYWKYKMGVGVEGLPTKCNNVSPSQLNNWHKILLERVYDISRFRLTIKDIFLHKKIINMLEAIALMLDVAKQIDPACEFIDDFWVNSLTHYYNNYRQLLCELENCIENPDYSRLNYVISMIVVYPFEKKEWLAKQCGCTPGTLGRYMHTFEQQVAQYVCA